MVTSIRRRPIASTSARRTSPRGCTPTSRATCPAESKTGAAIVATGCGSGLESCSSRTPFVTHSTSSLIDHGAYVRRHPTSFEPADHLRRLRQRGRGPVDVVSARLGADQCVVEPSAQRIVSAGAASDPRLPVGVGRPRGERDAEGRRERNRIARNARGTRHAVEGDDHQRVAGAFDHRGRVAEFVPEGRRGDPCRIGRGGGPSRRTPPPLPARVRADTSCRPGCGRPIPGRSASAGWRARSPG